MRRARGGWGAYSRPPILLVALALLVAGCIGVTPYRPMQLEGGYSSSRLGADTFSVTFQGNAQTPWATAEAYALYRSAEVVAEAGFDAFVVISGTTDAAALREAARAPHPDSAGGETRYPMVFITIRAFNGAPTSPDAFDAREVLRELAPQIRRQWQ